MAVSQPANASQRDVLPMRRDRAGRLDRGEAVPRRRYLRDMRLFKLG
jgi:hypothetical protein